MPGLPPHPDVDVLSNQEVWSGRYPLQLVKFRQRRFDGAMSKERTWELWRRGRAAAALPYDPVRDQVVLMEQFRLPALAAGMEPVLVEVPAGLCDGDETPEATIRREIEEEISLPAEELELIGEFLLSPGACDERCTIYAARVSAPDAGPDGIVGSGGLAGESEDIRIRVRPAQEAIADAIAGHYANSVTAISLLWLAAKRDWLRATWNGASAAGQAG